MANTTISVTENLMNLSRMMSSQVKQSEQTMETLGTTLLLCCAVCRDHQCHRPIIVICVVTLHMLFVLMHFCSFTFAKVGSDLV